MIKTVVVFKYTYAFHTYKHTQLLTIKVFRQLWVKIFRKRRKGKVCITCLMKESLE